MTAERVGTELVAVVTAVADDRPLVLTADEGQRLPSGPLRSEHRSLQAGLSAWVEQQTRHRLGYVEQLYTFADPDRSATGGRVVAVSYLGLTQAPTGRDEPEWRDWYSYFPWEDRRPGATGPTLVKDVIEPLLDTWVANARSAAERERRELRAAICFGLAGRSWSPELVLQRYELLHEAALIPESHVGPAADALVPGQRMQGDHRRILATGIARLRAKIQYHPVVFELMPDSFTLGQLQLAVEALAGQALHKQNFRRLVTQQDLVEPTGETEADTGGRPARLYRFRRAILDERTIAGTKLPQTR
ncbi:MAG: hypothetical protein L0H79_16080 [Intrasporangium sp.]|uniref:NUDIX hydrolase n=1 Tax=Intrasporangium sp. TaxID=1925024 RepID=UPI0026474BDF|nr:hypothetical protein [Intrasporangium sp.]MDN5797255.1 hypothetical protein [Intrasporangium sp.]